MLQEIVTAMILLPCLAAILQAVLSASQQSGEANTSGKWIALGGSILSGLCGILSVFFLEPGTASHYRTPWLGSFAIAYEVGVDGLNGMPILLISIIFPLAIIFEWERQKGVRGIQGLFLFLQAALAGTACSQDLFLIFFFWAISLLPLYFLVAIWGGDEREAAAGRFLATSAIGNGLFFLVLVLIYCSVDPQTFSIRELIGGRIEAKTMVLFGAEINVARLAFALFCAGLCCRIPIWPLHGWFSGLAVQAPPSVMVVFCGVFVPVALSIFTRIGFSLFPKELTAFGDVIIWVGSINLLFSALGAVGQRGLQRLLGFLCMALIGVTLVGIGSLDITSVVGSVYHGLSGGLGLAGFGILIGILRDRVGHSDFLNSSGEPVLGGVVSRAPLMALIAGVVVASILGFPGVSGFVGNALVMMGGYLSYPNAIICMSVSLLLLTYAIFTLYRHVFLGKLTVESAKVQDLSVRERGLLIPIVVLLISFGVYPRPLLDLSKPAVLNLLTLLK